MKSKIIQIGLIALLVLVLSNVAYAQVCEGTLSAPTKQVYVGKDFSISFYNHNNTDPSSTITLNLPPELTYQGTVDPNPVNTPTNETLYVWDVQANTTGTFLFNATVEGTHNCTITSSVIVEENVTEPMVFITIENLGSVIVNQAYNFDVNLTNVASAGNATDVRGTVASASGSALTPTELSHALIENGTTTTDTFTITPGYCGLDSITAYLPQIKDANGYDVTPIQPNAQMLFTVEGTDVAFTTLDVTGSVAYGTAMNLGFTVRNIDTTLSATSVSVTVLIDGNPAGTVAVPVTLAVNDTYTGSVPYTANLVNGTHTVTFQLTSDTECSDANNEASVTFEVTDSPYTGPFCGDGNVDAGEVCDGSNLNGETCTSVGSFTGGTLSCASDCLSFVTSSCSSSSTTPSSGGSGGGGSGGGSGSGRIYILVLTPEEPAKTLKLRSGDTVQYYDGTNDFSFTFRNIYSGKTTMGVAKKDGYESYTFFTGNNYNLNLDGQGAADLGVEPIKTFTGYGNFTFSLLNYEKKPIISLPFSSKKKTVETVEETADLNAEVEEVEPEEKEIFSEGVLDFVETLSVRSSAPLWAGILVAALIILLGLGSYFMLARNKEDDAPLKESAASKKASKADKKKSSKSTKASKKTAKASAKASKPAGKTKIKIGKKV